MPGKPAGHVGAGAGRHQRFRRPCCPQEELGRDERNSTLRAAQDADVVLGAETTATSATATLSASRTWSGLLGGNGGRGREGARKKVILLTATPINNQGLFSTSTTSSRSSHTVTGAICGGSQALATCTVMCSRRDGMPAAGIRRSLSTTYPRKSLIPEESSRSFVRKAYPEAVDPPQAYPLPGTPPQDPCATTWKPLAPTSPRRSSRESRDPQARAVAAWRPTRKKGVAVEDFEAGREQALVGIFKSRYLKRFE